MAGHFGQYKTLFQVTRQFWWPKVKEETKGCVKACETCQWVKKPREALAGLLQPLPTPQGPWEAIAMDFITDLPELHKQTVIWVVVELFSKMAHFVPYKKLPSAQKTAHLFVEHVFKLHGLPLKVISDRGARFISQF